MIKVNSAASAWIEATKYVLKNGIKYGDITEVLNGIIEIENFSFDRNFDDKFRVVFGDKKIDYVSAFTFNTPIDTPLGRQYKAVKPGWKNTYWGRMFSFNDKINQVEHVIKILKEKKNTKRCEIIIFRPEDSSSIFKQPCLLSIDFKPRRLDLYMTATFRSQRISKSGYGDYTALINFGQWLCQETEHYLKKVTVIAHSLHVANNEELKNSNLLLNML